MTDEEKRIVRERIKERHGNMKEIAEQVGVMPCQLSAFLRNSGYLAQEKQFNLLAIALEK